MEATLRGYHRSCSRATQFGTAGHIPCRTALLSNDLHTRSHDPPNAYTRLTYHIPEDYSRTSLVLSLEINKVIPSLHSEPYCKTQGYSVHSSVEVGSRWFEYADFFDLITNTTYPDPLRHVLPYDLAPQPAKSVKASEARADRSFLEIEQYESPGIPGRFEFLFRGFACSRRAPRSPYLLFHENEVLIIVNALWQGRVTQW